MRSSQLPGHDCLQTCHVCRDTMRSSQFPGHDCLETCEVCGNEVRSSQFAAHKAEHLRQEAEHEAALRGSMSSEEAERRRRVLENARGYHPCRCADKRTLQSPPGKIKDDVELELGRCLDRGVRGNLNGTVTSIVDYMEYEIRNQNKGELWDVNVYLMRSSKESMKCEVQGTNKEQQYATYLQRVLFFSQTCCSGGCEQQNKEVFFFAMYVYEFGEDCGIPANSGRVYISYLDSTPFYHAPKNGHNLFQTIVSAYCHYASALGFKHAHLWSCPPKDVDGSYIFFTGKLSKSKVRKPDKLKKFYMDTFDRGCGKLSYKTPQHYDQVPANKLALFPGDIKCDWVKEDERRVPRTQADIFEVDLAGSRWHAQYFEVLQLYDRDKEQMDRAKVHGHPEHLFRNRSEAYASTATMLQKRQGLYMSSSGRNVLGSVPSSIPIVFGPGVLPLGNIFPFPCPQGHQNGIHSGCHLALVDCVVNKRRGNYAGRWTCLVDYMEWELRNLYGGDMMGMNVHLVNSTIDQFGQASCLERTLLFTQRTCSSWLEGSRSDPGTEVIVFGIHVFEFANDCGLPCSGTVYINWFGSTPYLEKPKGACDPDGAILSAYCRYAGALGFTSAQIRCSPQCTSFVTTSMSSAGLENTPMQPDVGQPMHILVDLRRSQWFGRYFEDFHTINNWQLVRDLGNRDYTSPARAYDTTHWILQQIEGQSFRNTCKIINHDWPAAFKPKARSELAHHCVSPAA